MDRTNDESSPGNGMQPPGATVGGAAGDGRRGSRQGSCRRCGTCCRQGGPALHLEDRTLVDSGKLPLSVLFTIRAGERVRDNVRGTLETAAEEMIKLKGQGGTWTCVLYDAAVQGCSRYSQRPLECRVLRCWDTRELEGLYAQRRLTRRDLLSGIAGLWELVADHEERCGYARLRQLVAALEDGGRDVAAQVVESVSYDTELRRLVTTRGGLDPAATDFLLGRPLKATLCMFGLALVTADGAVRLERRPGSPPA